MSYHFFSYLPKFWEYNNPVRLLKNCSYMKKFMSKEIRYSKFYDKKGVDLDVYIVAFNNQELIEKQIYFLEKNCLDKYNLIIVDNSSDIKISGEIKKLCEKKKIDYVRLPENNKLVLSQSHGISLNYIVKNIALNRPTKYFGFLDHDCYLIKTLSIVEILERQKIFGFCIDKTDADKLVIFGKEVSYVGNRWFLWPGCSFFRKELFMKGYNFLPVKSFIPFSFLDTGGGNWKYIYRNINKEEIYLLKRKYKNGYQYLDDKFFHIGGVGRKEKEFSNKGIEYLLKNYG